MIFKNPPTLLGAKRMLDIPLVNRNARPATLLTSPAPPLDKLVPHMVRNPVVLSAVKHEEPWRGQLRRRGRHLPQLVTPLVLEDGVELRLAHVQRLQHAVPALEPLGRHVGGARREAHGVLDDPAQRPLRKEAQESLGVGDKVRLHGGQAAHVVDARAALRQRERRNGGKEEESVAETEVRRAAGVLHVSVEDLDGDVGADGVAHEDDKVVGLVAAAAVLGADAARGDVLVDDVHLPVDVAGRVVRGEGLVLMVAEAGEVAAVDVVGRGGLGGVEEVAQGVEEVDVEADEAGVAADEVDERAGFGAAELLRGLPYGRQHGC